jgi:hypothetical protein
MELGSPLQRVLAFTKCAIHYFFAAQRNKSQKPCDIVYNIMSKIRKDERVTIAQVRSDLFLDPLCGSVIFYNLCFANLILRRRIIHRNRRSGSAKY